MGRKNDKALRIYHEVFELDRLHYGMWLPEEQLSIDNLKKAQQRYEKFLIDHIPEGVKTVLDVGCGTGIMAQSLLDAGYDAEGLSPDVNQKEIFTQNLDVPFHHSTFGQFQPPKKYDCIMMSESAQYIKLGKLFKVAAESLQRNGYLLVCDYFVQDGAEGIFTKSGHPYEKFLNRAAQEGFTKLNEQDITDTVLKTLQMGKMAVDKLMLTLDIITEKARRNHPYILRLLKWAFRNRIKKYNRQIQLLDADQFRQNKTYRFLLFQLNNDQLKTTHET